MTFRGAYSLIFGTHGKQIKRLKKGDREEDVAEVGKQSRSKHDKGKWYRRVFREVTGLGGRRWGETSVTRERGGHCET